MKYISGISFTLILQLSLLMIVNAQNKEALRFARRIEPIADEYYRIGDFKRALEGYQVLDSILSGNTKYNYRIGMCYLQTNFKSKAYPFLEFVYRQDDAPETIFFDLGRAYHYGMELEKAMIFYESYKKQIRFYPETDDPEQEIARIDRYIQMCRNGLRLVRNPIVNVTVVNLGPGINSEYSDFSPLINKDEDLIIYTSKRQATASTKSDPLTDQFYESIFYSEKKGGVWEDAVCIGPPVNHDDLHDAAVGLSPQGSQLFVYRGDDNSFSARIAGDIYTSNYRGDQWTEPVIIDEISSEGWESHASVSEDGNILVFTSDREGGLGGTDIYISRKKLNGKWSEPENIGGYINTKYDEDGPFIHPDGNKLYFSSKGHDSMGDYDIFYSEYLEGKQRWTRPDNLGYPINTADDDIFFVWSADGQRAYFSSEREDSFGETDIYMLVRNDENVPLVEITGAVSDKVTKNPVKAQLIVRDRLNNQLIGIYDTELQDGNFRMELKDERDYLLTLRSDGYQEIYTDIDLTGDNPAKVERNFEIRSLRR